MHVERGALLAVALCALVAGGALAQPPRPERLAACAACHGPDGRSRTREIPSLAGQPKLFIETQLVLIREGLRDVPAMKALMAEVGDAEIVALAGHYAAQPAAAAAGPVDAAQSRRGEATAGRMLCGTCHLSDYAGQRQVPRLAGQDESYLLQSMKAFRDHPGPGRDTIMAATLRGLGDAELADLAHYFAGLGRTP